MLVDPFDVEWRTDDPLGREIVLLRSTVDTRAKAGKHQGDEMLPSSEIRAIVEDPDRIDLTGKNPRHTEIYYREQPERSHPYSRVVVYFDEQAGYPISWSRYQRPVSYLERVYERRDAP